MDLPSELIALLSAFGAAGVRYLLVGGHAVSAHGRPRATKDLDLWLAGDPANLAKTAEALEAFGAPRAIGEAIVGAGPTEIVWFGRPPMRVDLLQTIAGVEFESCWARRSKVVLDGIEVPLIAHEDLIRNKLAAGRPQDRRDARALGAELPPRKRPRRGK